MAAQLTVTKGCDDRADPLWMARATSSFPVPVSPVMRTVESVGATRDTRASTALSGADVPTLSSNIDAWSTSSRRARFSARIRRPGSARRPGSPSGSTTTAPIGRRSRNTGSVTMRTWPPRAREPMVCSYPSGCPPPRSKAASTTGPNPTLAGRNVVLGTDGPGGSALRQGRADAVRTGGLLVPAPADAQIDLGDLLDDPWMPPSREHVAIGVTQDEHVLRLAEVLAEPLENRGAHAQRFQPLPSLARPT